MTSIIAIYCDGGVVGSNPSYAGGSWAWVGVDASNQIVASDSGWVTPEQAGNERITNNYTELLAAVLAMESLPTGFRGTIYTDSKITLLRITKSRSFAGIPEELRERAKRERCRLRVQMASSYRRAGSYHIGSMRVSGTGCHAILLGGHPTVAELRTGRRRDGALCSEWNCWCDRECGRRGGELKGILKRERMEPDFIQGEISGRIG